MIGKLIDLLGMRKVLTAIGVLYFAGIIMYLNLKMRYKVQMYKK